MARQYVVTEAEMIMLIESLELVRMKSQNINDPYRHLDESWRNLTDKEKENVKPAIDSIHRGFHYVVTRWAQDMGFDGRRR